jgi:hypothetical protein
MRDGANGTRPEASRKPPPPTGYNGLHGFNGPSESRELHASDSTIVLLNAL